VLICKVFRLDDPRLSGSQNAGATNVLRLGGKLAGVLTLAGDMLKGLLPVWLAKQLDQSNVIMAATGLAAVTGHLLPIYHGFRGGKGVATSLGVMGIWYWPCAAMFIGAWTAIALLTRYASLASMLGCLAAVFYAVAFSPMWGEPVMLLCALVLFRHRPNLQNLKEGREPRLGETRRER
jgi:glycerol-3-phosphate acyltransferase PlsY